MKRKHKQKLRWVLACLIGLVLVVSLVLYFLNEQANYYYDPSSIVAKQAPEHKRIRAGGVVVAGSVRKDPHDPLKVNFAITDFQHSVTVYYTGILPDLFKEDSGVVVQGQLENNTFIAEEVLAKHDENYMPPEVEKTLKKE